MIDKRSSLVEAMRAMAEQGLNRGSSGNCSLRTGGGMAITPSGVPADDLSIASIVQVSLAGEHLDGNPVRPSSEWPMHAAIYAAREDVDAIVHCHSRYATALACTGRGIPAFNYMVAVAGGDSIRCAPYALFGSTELAAHAVAALQDRRACLLANHGLLCVGESITAALALAVEVEELAAQYWSTLAIGGPSVLDATAMAGVLARFTDYGQR